MWFSDFAAHKDEVREDEQDSIQNLCIVPQRINKIVVVADSGTQLCLWSRDEFLGCVLEMGDLYEVHHEMEAANAAPIRIEGAIILRLSALSLIQERNACFTGPLLGRQIQIDST